MTTYISQGIKFKWKVHIFASRLDPPEKCQTCGGSGKKYGGWGVFDDYDEKKECDDCYGKGYKPWTEPFLPPHFEDYLQSLLEESLEHYMATDNIFVTLYAVHQDDGDRECGYPKWYFTDKAKAQYVANGRGWYGGNAPISEIKTVRGIDGKLYVVTSTEPLDKLIDIGPEDELKMKEKALNKLSPYERKLLGLDK